MEISGGCEVEWTQLVVAGDAASLIAVFRGAVGSAPPDASALRSVSAFLEAHTFPAALQVDLPRVFSTTSTEYAETALGATRSSGLDAREVLSELLAMDELPDGYALAVYVRLIRAALRQVLLDTLRRKKRLCASVEEPLSQTQATLRAWYPGVEKRLSQLIPTVCQHDAVPKMVRAVNNFQDDGDGVDSEGSGEYGGDDQANGTSLVEPGALEALLLLSLDLLHMLGEPHTVAPLLLMVRASLVAAQPYNDTGEFLRRIGTDLRHWAKSFCRVEDTKTDRNAEDATAQKLPAVTTARDAKKMGETIVRALLEIVPPGEIFSYLQRGSSNAFTKDLMDSVTYEDNEHGKDTSDAKALVTLHDLRREKDGLRVLSDDDSESAEDNDDVSLTSLSLRKIGAMLLLYDVMTLDGLCDQELQISQSPESFLFLTGAMVLESLKSSSLSVVMTGLSFLATLLPHVLPYSILAHGELHAKSGQIHELGQQHLTAGTWGFRTKRFELIFELVKALMNISATCPSECHREVSRGVFVTLLRRCASNLRMLIYSLFLVLTPFASLCSLMLHSLRVEWNESQTSASTSEAIFLQDTLPTLLLRAQENWVRKLRVGEVTFLDPLIQSISFLRCIIIEDRKRNQKDALFRLDPSRAKVELHGEAAEDAKSGRWNLYLHQLLKNVVPPLRTMASAPPAASATAMGVLGGVTLSPLDCFALSRCLDGLQEHVVFTG
ncbi:uncharacterized protein Tco025E_06816 [Trypanosoma conorhini]|uniref:Uncharacterized protein n=1 Tax=Trypanosoma conorhini TaxID=83891 RepID=A0A422NY01_9TRYP|nr:uncharacterized protein Tco025E_06816 [Trypanosoma conorhini]RNF10383.1 hypothetical protein Tco025E_06816 [Trypanosoma conorhini]